MVQILLESCWWLFKKYYILQQFELEESWKLYLHKVQRPLGSDLLGPIRLFTLFKSLILQQKKKWVNYVWLVKAELASLSVSILAQRQQYSVPVFYLRFLNPHQIWPFLLLTTAESSGQVLQILPNQNVKLSCFFDLLQLALPNWWFSSLLWVSSLVGFDEPEIQTVTLP